MHTCLKSEAICGSRGSAGLGSLSRLQMDSSTLLMVRAGDLCVVVVVVVAESAEGGVNQEEGDNSSKNRFRIFQGGKSGGPHIAHTTFP